VASDLQKKWEERIKRAQKVKEEWMEQFRVKMGRDYFEGRQNPGYPEEEWISIPKVYSHLQAQLPALYSVDPTFYVKLKKSYAQLSAEDLAAMQQGQTPPIIEQMEKQGKSRQSMLNYLKGELDMKAKARLGIQDAHFAFGVIKVRRASDQEEHPHAGEPILNEEGVELTDETTGEALVYPDTLPVNERYEMRRIHPDDFLVDDDAGPLEDSWGWLAQHVSMTKTEALDDVRFKRADVQAIKANTKEGKKEKGAVAKFFSGDTKADDDELIIDTWEIYDLKKREMLILAENGETLLMKPRSLPPGVERHPFGILRFTLRDNSPYPIPPVSPGIDPQKEISLSRSMMLTHRKRFNRKYEYNINMVDKDEISKLESGGDGTLIGVNAIGNIAPIQDAPLSQQNFQELALMNNDMNEAMGSPDSARGIASSDSATEASILDNRMEVREGDRLSMVIDWITLVARKLDMLVQFHIDEDEAVKITGPQGEVWQMVKKTDYEEIQGEFQYSINVGATQPRLPDIERAQIIAFFSQVVIPMPHILTVPATMKKMAELFHIEDEAMVEELRQLGLKMMSGQVPMPGQSQGGGPEGGSAVSNILGAALGQLGGNTNGGGAPTVQ
jgi:hypothetical protein